MAQGKGSKGLGKGLSALISQTADNTGGDRLEQIDVQAIEANDRQPRKAFSEEKLEGLVESIRENGIIQPLILRTVRPGKYEIVAGERRWRAARSIGLKTVPAVIRDVDETEKMKQALIENIVREDLNAIEEAEAINTLIESHHLLQEDVAKILGRSRTAITNTLRLRQLDPDLRKLVIDGKLTAGHARALLAIDDRNLRKTIALQIVENSLSVRATESLVNRCLSPQPQKTRPAESVQHSISVKDLERRLKRHFGTNVQVQDAKVKGKVVISYTSLDELDRLLEQWGIRGTADS